LDFIRLSLGDITALRPYFEHNDCRICDCTIGGTFMWRDFYKTHYAIQGGLLYLKVEYLPGVIAFAPPRGDAHDRAEAYEAIRQECRVLGVPPRVCAVSAGRLQELLQIYPDARYETNRDCPTTSTGRRTLSSLPGGATPASATTSTLSCGSTRTGPSRR